MNKQLKTSEVVYITIMDYATSQIYYDEIEVDMDKFDIDSFCKVHGFKESSIAWMISQIKPDFIHL